MPESAYLKPTRYADLVAAIQMMAEYRLYRLPPIEWARRISGRPDLENHWKGVFDDHPEFFRLSENHRGEYGLVYRRAKAEINIVGDIPGNRPVLKEDETKMLLHIALELHTKALAMRQDRRLGFQTILGLANIALGVALIGVRLFAFK
jgi:hypothetical protein